MKRYSEIEERNIRLHALVREWARSGLLDERQSVQLAEEVRPTVKRTNIFLRCVLLLFTLFVVFASVLLVLEVLDVTDHQTTAFICGAGGILCTVLAEVLIARARLYRFGVEEGLTLAGVALAIIVVVQMAPDVQFERLAVIGLSIGAIGGFALYRRYGFVYAGVAAIACAAIIPFPLLHDAMAQRLLAGATLGTIFLLFRPRYVQFGDDFPGDDYNIFQTSAWAGLYLVMNLQITFGNINHGWFYWATYVITWVLPIAGFHMSLRKKDRLLMDSSVTMALATLTTNKPYLHLPRQTWDPILFGIFLIGAAVLIRRWLLSSPTGERFGFTEARILNKDARLMTVVKTASAAFQPQTFSATAAAPQPDFQGGRSGGAGASGEF